VKPATGSRGVARLDEFDEGLWVANEAFAHLSVVDRLTPQIDAFRRFLASGRLGAIEEVHSDFFIGARFGGFRVEMDHPLLLDMAIHTFDQARFLSGADPVAVYCHGFNPGRSWYKGDGSAVAIFEMTGGLVFTYRGSWCAEGCNTSWECDWRFQCANGAALWDGADSFRAERMKTTKKSREGFFGETETLVVPVRKMAHTGHDGCIREFIECVREGGQPQTRGEDNIKSLAMVMAAVKSSNTGRRVKVSG
jgi:predicted dehydrogenase